MLSIRKTRLQALREAHPSAGGALTTLRDEPERFLATVQIGITVVGTTAAAFGGSAISRMLEPVVYQVPLLRPWSHQIAFGLVVVFISYLSLVLGELVPKSLALRAAEPYALVLARPLLGLSTVVRPLVWLLTASSNLILRPFADRTNFSEGRISKEEVQLIVDEAGKSGALAEHTSELASRALEFEGLSAGEIMVPRNRMVTLAVNASHEEIKLCLMEERRSRMPIWEGTPDNVIGYVTAKDLLPLAWEDRLIVLRDVLRPVRMVGEGSPAVELLAYMRRERQRMAIVIDEHGAVAGLVTFEDIVEELVGEVFSEQDVAIDPILREVTGTLLVRGEVALRDVNRELTVPLEIPEGVVTVAGLAIALSGGVVPHRGARLAANDGIVLFVDAVTARSVRRVRVIPPPGPDDDSTTTTLPFNASISGDDRPTTVRRT